jgi:ATP-dependent DNA helicase RecG
LPALPRLSEIDGRLSTKEFWRLVGRMEHEELDFKESAGHLDTVIPAMAMTSGGLLVLGVSDARHLVGCPLDQKTFDRVHRQAQACGVDVQTRAVSVDGIDITLVAVPDVRGRIVTTTDGRLLRRVGSDNQPLVGDALGRFVRAREEISGEEGAVAGFDAAQLDLGLVNEALRRERRSRVSRQGVLRALVDLGVAEALPPPLDPRVMKAAIVLFGHDPRTVIRAAAVQIVRRAGVGPEPAPVREREELVGPIPTLVDAVVAFVERHTSTHEAVIGTHRERLPEYPIEVLREAVLNALAHRDYGLDGATVDVTVWDDRVEIQSPGPLPGHITRENMRDEHFSRNRRVMAVLKILGLVEEYGEGVDRMFEAMEARLLEPPTFVSTPSSLTVTLRNRSLIAVQDQVWLALLGNMALTPSERRLLVVARHEGSVTPRRLREVSGDFDVDSLLAGALAKGLLVRVGRGGGTRYVLSDEVVLRAGGGGHEARTRQRETLLDEIRRRGSLSTIEAAAHLATEDRTLVKQLLDDLVRAGDLMARGRTRARRYHASDTASPTDAHADSR